MQKRHADRQHAVKQPVADGLVVEPKKDAATATEWKAHDSKERQSSVN